MTPFLKDPEHPTIEEIISWISFEVCNEGGVFFYDYNAYPVFVEAFNYYGMVMFNKGLLPASQNSICIGEIPLPS